MDGLFRRGGVWWARLVVPQRLRHEVGRREFVRSCRTSDQRQAKLIAGLLLAGWRLQLHNRASSPVTIDLLKIVEGAGAFIRPGHYALEDACALTGLGMADILTAASRSLITLFCRIPRTDGLVVPIFSLQMQRVTSNPEGGYRIRDSAPAYPSRTKPPDYSFDDTAFGVVALFDSGGVAEELLATRATELVVRLLEHNCSHVFAPDVPPTIAVGRLEVQSDQVEALRVQQAGAVTSEQLAAARVARGAVRASANQGKWGQKRFHEAVDAYCASPDGMARTLVSSHEQRQRRGGLMLFAEFMGDVPLSEIDGDVLRAFRDGPLKCLPGNRNRLPKEIQRATMKETMAALRDDGRQWPLMSAGMQHERMLQLYRLFEWLAAPARGYLKVNPAEGLRLDTGLTKAERKEHIRAEAERKATRKAETDGGDDEEEGRRPFSAEELRLIFGQPQFVTGHGRHSQGNGLCDPFEYWLPLLAACQGLRLKEGAQLHLTDVRQLNGVWCLDINEATADKTLKNAQSARIVPLHPEIVRLGFLDYCEALRTAGFRRVFPELTWFKSDARYAKEAGRKMSSMLGGLGMPRDGSLVFHCLRHCFNNALARVPGHVVPDADDRLRAYMRYRAMGHKLPDDVNASNYTRVTMEEMAAIVGALNYEGLPDVAPFNLDFGIGAVWAALSRKKHHRHLKEDMGPLGQFAPGVDTR